MSGFQQLARSNQIPGSAFKVQKVPQFLHGEGKEGIQQKGEIGSDLKGNIQNGFYPFRIGFDHLPGFCIGQVFVAQAGQVHGCLDGLPETKLFQALLHTLSNVSDLLKYLLVAVQQSWSLPAPSLKIFMGQHNGPVYKIPQDGHQFVVVAVLEVLPGKIVVLVFRSIGTEHITHHILFAREIFQVFMQPDGPVPGGGDLVVLQVQKFVGRNIFGQDVSFLRPSAWWEKQCNEIRCCPFR